jgi:hypothetical protein
MIRSASDCGRKLKRFTLRAAIAVSVEKAMTGTPAGLATEAAAATDWEKSGPMISSAPCEIASVAAWRAPSGVPRSSLTIICRLAPPWNSRSARSAAFFRLAAIAPALPVAEDGTSRATRTVPVPSVSPLTGGLPFAAGAKPAPEPPMVEEQAVSRPSAATQAVNTPALRPSSRSERNQPTRLLLFSRRM